ncbi:hypothetical protein [Paenibacillus lutrae]|uniref:Uncharacterized protein n=1 Tax=Paenibacillus lutrae TaxID=2078573 RepID=A0A7X3FIV1_9BACL|nr:hypothetical protein [Paenibacillus lutrae]MVP00387.1 hypothetical protein [Paenibacillus lutrae]
MTKTIRHDGKEFIVVEEHGPDEVTAYRESVKGHIEIYTAVPFYEPRVDLLHIKSIEKILAWREFTEEVERNDRQLELHWRLNREIEQEANVG